MNITKMVLVPADSQVGGNENIPQENLVVERPKRIDRNPEKIQKLLKIALKIALNNAYDEDFKIRDNRGNPISDSDITLLLNSAISPQKILVGEDDFVRVLYESKVNPNWIVNDNLRSKLLNYYPRNPPRSPPNTHDSPSRQQQMQTIPKQIDTNHAPPTNKSVDSQSRMGNSTSNKRKVDEDIIKETKKPKQTQAWEVPLPDGEDDEL